LWVSRRPGMNCLNASMVDLEVLEFCRFDDRVLRVFVDELSDFPKYIGGMQYTPKLIPILEKLCYCDDSYVREKMYACMIMQNRHIDGGRTNLRVRK
jgi:hypothetical protein